MYIQTCINRWIGRGYMHLCSLSLSLSLPPPLPFSLSPSLRPEVRYGFFCLVYSIVAFLLKQIAGLAQNIKNSGAETKSQPPTTGGFYQRETS